MLCKTTNGITTKYVYGLGLIGEEKQGCFKTYHFDFRGSTVAITDANGTITDTFVYDTYGKLISRTGSSFVIFGYNGRDGVVTDKNGLIYMRARYYAPELRRFVNADIVSGSIENSVTLNRFSYANGNPVSFIDPFGLCGERNGGSGGRFGEVKDTLDDYKNSSAFEKIKENAYYILHYAELYGVDPGIVAGVIMIEQYHNYDWVDICTDWIGSTGIIDMSVGLGQVRHSTAKYLEDTGYIPKINSVKIHTYHIYSNNESSIRHERLEDNSWNIRYVAAYIKALTDLWTSEYPEISSDPAILGSLYNLGHNKSPHDNPKANWFGTEVSYVYNLMTEELSELKKKGIDLI